MQSRGYKSLILHYMFKNIAIIDISIYYVYIDLHLL